MLSHTDINHRSVVLIDSTEKHYKFRVELGNLVLIEKIEEEKYPEEVVLTRLNKQKVLGIFVVGRLSVTTVMLDYCQKNAIALVTMNSNFRLTGFWSNSAEANYLLRKKQYTHECSMDIAKWLVKNKIDNQVIALSRLRDQSELIQNAINSCTALALRCCHMENLADLMGLEGNAAKIYFKSMFFDNGWQGRKPRVKTDPLNVILDIGYTFLFNYIESFVRLFGFDVYKGNLHQTWFRRKSLICDMVEPFRVLIDYQVRKSLNLREFQFDHFVCTKSQYAITPKYIKVYSKTFFEVLVSHKLPIFLFVRDYYRAFMADKPINDYPIFVAFEPKE